MILAASVLMVGVVAGCDKNKKGAETQPSASISDVTPPAPSHSSTTGGSTWSDGSASSTPVTPINYDQQPSDSQFASNTGSSFGAAPAATTSGGPVAGRTYKVQRGDTLWSIAKRTYGDGAQYRKIVAANPSVRNDRLIVGQTITLP
jgi:nucleoid-associated protein YgaU